MNACSSWCGYCGACEGAPEYGHEHAAWAEGRSMSHEGERCLACNGEGHYWTRERNQEKVDHRCEVCHGSGWIVPEPEPGPDTAPAVEVPVHDDAPVA